MKYDEINDTVTLELFITGKCNMNCSYCHLQKTLPLVHMSKNIAFEAISFFLHTRSVSQLIDLHLTGGEPFLNCKLIHEIVDFISGIDKIKLRITTNGTLLNKEICSFLRCHDIMLSISIDGNREMHEMYRGREFDYTSILNNLKIVQESGTVYEVGISLHPQNVHLVRISIEYLAGIGVRNFRVAPVYGAAASWDDMAIKDLIECLMRIADFAYANNLEISPFNYDGEHIGEKFKNQWGCAAGWKTLAVLPDGVIAPCSALVPYVSSLPFLVQGKIPDGLTKNNASFCQYTKRELHSNCLSCPSRDNCLGGCPAINLATTQDIFCNTKWYCELVKAFPMIWEHRWK